MLNIVASGSCFSHAIVEALKNARPEATRAATINHVRSDVIVEALIEKKWEIPSYEEMLAVAAAHGLPDKAGTNSRRLAAQSREKLAQFVGALATADIIVLDDHYDVVANLFDAGPELGAGVKLRLLAKPGLKSRNTGMLPPGRSRANFERILRWLREAAPKARIFFAPVPPSALKHALSRHRGFGKAINDTQWTNLPKGVHVLPKLNIPDAKKDLRKGNFYFTADVYARYAEIILDCLEDAEAGSFEAFVARFADMAEPLAEARQHAGAHPYESLPDRNYWRPAVGGRNPLAITGLYRKRFDIAPIDRIAAFGSCFAQHIGHRLRQSGFNFLDYEPAPPELTADEARDRGFGMYSARYGNIYSPRQLTQLFQRAFGRFQPMDQVWEDKGRFLDPFRPTIVTGGFASREEMEADRATHLEAVKRLFLDAEVIIFTFGLTEAWFNVEDGAVYPLCPGTAGGTFDPVRHRFKNYNVVEVIEEFSAFMTLIAEVNPNVRYLLTVSPVPLVATASNEHVLNATSKSKSILRAACAHLVDQHDNVDYFPSYEIVSAFPMRAMFYEPNLRNVASEGVDHVMKQFFLEHGGEAASPSEDFEEKCDEILLAGSAPA